MKYEDILKEIEKIKNLEGICISAGAKNIPYDFYKNFAFTESDICLLVYEDIDFFVKCVKFLNEKTNYYIKKEFGHECIKTKLKDNIIKKDDTFKKKKYSKFYNVILKWFIDTDYIINIIDEIDTKKVTKEDIVEYQKKNYVKYNEINKFIPRINQKEAFDLLDKEGIKTGIHCQATGAGKTFIILKYIDYAIKKYNKNFKGILFTERVSILSDLFDFDKEDGNANKKNIKEWKRLGIADFTKLKIINRVTKKKKDWVSILKKSKEPTLLVINRSYLTSGNLYNNFKKNELKLILHDECHNTSSNQCNDFLKYCIKLGVPTVGFSATPLRSGKNDIKKLIEIYGNNKILNLLTNYNMMYSITHNLILPPVFYWFVFKQEHVKNNKTKIYQEELGSVMRLLDEIVPKMPNKKIVAWCGTIYLAKKWKRLFQTHNKLYPNLKKFRFYIDTSQTKGSDYEKFKRRKGSCIMFCACKHREGSDIERLDACMFLDKVKNRGCIPFIQSIGRILRKDNTNTKKICGFVIDGISKDNVCYEKQFVNKIIGYYLMLQNMTDGDDGDSKYDQYIHLYDAVTFDKENKIIKLTIKDRVVDINCNILEWDNIVNKFGNILQQKIGISVEENMYHKGRILVDKLGFNVNSDFYYKYKKISKDIKKKYNLPEIDTPEYNNTYKLNSWFDILGLKHNFYETFEEAKKEIIKMGYIVNNGEIKEKWNEICEKNKRIPKYPKYVWTGFSFNLL